MIDKVKHNKFFLTFFRFFGSLLNHLFFKKNRIVLYSNWGFRDNVRYMYDYLIDHDYNEKIEIVCASNDFYGLDRQHVENVKFISRKGSILYFFMTSKYFMYCFGGIPIRSTSKQTVINLWHGMPIKRIGKLEDKNSRALNYFDYVLSYSNFFSRTLEKSFDVSEKKILIANAPRNTPFINSERNHKKLKKVAWLPTYRQSSRLESINGGQAEIVPLLNKITDFKNLSEYLNNKNIFLYIKLHPLQDTPQNFKNFENIKFIDDNWLFKRHTGLYEFLAKTDALITDYSSISIDYLLLNRPIYYIMDDKSSYSKNRGFNFSIKQFVAGKEIMNLSQLYEIFDDIENSRDEFYDLRCRKLDEFYRDKTDGTKQILKHIGI